MNSSEAGQGTLFALSVTNEQLLIIYTALSEFEYSRDAFYDGAPDAVAHAKIARDVIKMIRQLCKEPVHD